MQRSIGFDHPEQTFAHLDVPSWELTPAAASAAVTALLSGAAETALRHVAGRYSLFERSFRDAPADSRPSLGSGLFDEVVITGGAGAVGLHYARYLAMQGARRVVLLSRHPADPEVLRGLAAEHGTQLVSASCDVTDRAEMARVAAQYGGDGASLIVHAAGSAAFGAGLTTAAADTFAAKVVGLAHLADLWPVRADARMVLCSSVSGVWGGRGHAAYSAANRVLDVMAAQLRAAGRHCVAVKWGLWQGSAGAGRGIVDAAGIAHIARSGLRPMAPQAAIEASLREWREDPLVFSADADRLRKFLDRRRSEVPGAPPTEATAHHDPTVPVVDAVRAQLAAVLGLDRADRLDLGASLFDLGIDSMLAVDLRKRLNRVIGRTVSLATLTGEITVAQLVEKLESADGLSDGGQKVDIARD
jgi:mycobactin polyketide synthetase MbtD